MTLQRASAGYVSQQQQLVRASHAQDPSDSNQSDIDGGLSNVHEQT